MNSPSPEQFPVLASEQVKNFNAFIEDSDAMDAKSYDMDIAYAEYQMIQVDKKICPLNIG